MQNCFTRRQMIGAGAAALALPTIGLPLWINPGLPAPFRAIYDERFDAGRRFASEASARGWVTRAIRGDVTNVWFHELAVRWKRGPAPIAGLTTEQSLFVLERLSWDVGMRVTARDIDATTHLVRWQISLPNRGGRSS
jgi:hypothetical protein